MSKLRFQDEVEAIDAQWDAERQWYVYRGRWGAPHLPNRANIIRASVLLIFGALVMTVLAVLRGGWQSPAPFVGILFVVLGFAWSAYCLKSANRYETARQNYLQRREKAVQAREAKRQQMRPKRVRELFRKHRQRQSFVP